MFVTRVESVEGMLHVRVFAKGTPPKLLAWCVCPDSAEGRAAAQALAGIAPSLLLQDETIAAQR